MKAFLSYKDERGNDIEGLFEVLEQKENYVKIQTSKNIIIIPYHRVNKISLKGGKE